MTELAFEQFARGHTVWLRARGDSMWPTLRDGDRLRLSPELADAPVGAVMLLAVGERWVIHRVTARLGPWRRLEGDALPLADGWYPATLFTARVVEARRGDQVVPLGGRPAALGSRLVRHARRRLPWVAPLIRQARQRLG